MACTSKYVYSNCQIPNAGGSCRLYTDSQLTSPVGAGYFKFTSDGYIKQFATNSSGYITSVNTCSWSSNQIYAPLYSGQRNNCDSGGVGSTVNVNDGGAYSYSGSGSGFSYVSQADADSQALTAAMNNFNAGIQGYINSVGTCTYTASNISASYTGYFTKNDCGANCYGSASIEFGTTRTATAQSTVSYQDAYNSAYSAAYNDAVNYVNGGAGQAHANSTGSCCCWVSDPTCSGCNRLGDRQRNTCTNEYRYTNVTAYNTCDCGPTCAGTYWGSPYCNGTTTKYRDLLYSCNGSYAGTTETMETCSSFCGTDTSPLYTYQNYTTCYNCYDAPVYKDTRGVCSSTNNQYYIENQSGNKVFVGGQPTGGSCNTSSNCQDTGSPYCSGTNWVINRYQANPCSNESCPSPRVIEYNSQANGCYTPPSCKIYEVFMYGSNPEYVYFHYQDCYTNGVVYTSTYNDGGGGSGGTYCAIQGTAYIDSGTAQFIDTGSSCGPNT